MIEQRLDDSGLSQEALIQENERNLQLCREKGCDYFLLENRYEIGPDEIIARMKIDIQ